MPVIKLTTIGRVSGKDRSVMLTSPVKSDGDICLVASKGGDDRHPEWYLNLLRDPRVKVESLQESKVWLLRSQKVMSGNYYGIKSLQIFQIMERIKRKQLGRFQLSF